MARGKEGWGEKEDKEGHFDNGCKEPNVVAGLCIRHKLNEAANIDMKELHADYTDITVRESEIITKLTADLKELDDTSFCNSFCGHLAAI